MRGRQVDLGNATLNDAFQQLRADYNASKQSRFQRRRAGVSSTGTTADYHYRRDTDYYRMMELSWDIFRNDIVVGQGVRRLVNNIVQDGFSLDPDTGDKKLDVDLSSRWKSYTEDPDQCDLAGENDFHEQEKLTLQHVIVGGDICNLPNVDGPIESVEGHRLKTPSGTKQNVVHGVLLNNVRKRMEYWFAKDDIGVTSTVKKVGDMRRIAARDAEGNRQVFHAYRRDRVSQTRGVTAFAPFTDATGMHDDLQFAMLVKAQVASCFVIFEEQQLNIGAGGGVTQTGARTSEAQADGTSRTLQGIAPGMTVGGKPGVKYQGFAPNIPNPEFFPHATLILTFIAVNLGLPVQLLLLDPKQTNFSGWRGAMDQARIGFRDFQRWLISAFHRPVYRWKVRQWMAQDRALRSAAGRNDINLFGHNWNLPRWPYIEPMTDAAADLLRMRNHLASPRMVAAERGYEWESVYTQSIDDNAKAIVAARQRAKEINAQFPDGEPVDWREVLSLPTPDRVTASMTATLTQPSAKQGQGDANAGQ